MSAQAEVGRLAGIVAERRTALQAADEAAEVARRARRAAETSAESARRDAAKVGAQLAAANQFLRSHTSLDGARSLADELSVEPGLELALAAALGGRLGAAVVSDRAEGAGLLDRAGADGGHALVQPPGPRRRTYHDAGGPGRAVPRGTAPHDALRPA